MDNDELEISISNFPNYHFLWLKIKTIIPLVETHEEIL
jgi:hypothetical protein